MVKQRSKLTRLKTKHATEVSGKIRKRTDAESTSKKKTKAVPYSGRESKQTKLIALLERPEGASIAELMKATGWQAHSVRGVMSGALKKRLGLTITSENGDGGRVYCIASDTKTA